MFYLSLINKDKLKLIIVRKKYYIYTSIVFSTYIDNFNHYIHYPIRY